MTISKPVFIRSNLPPKSPSLLEASNNINTMSSAEEVLTIGAFRDEYRTHMNEEDVKNIQWRHGGPPTYDAVNKLFHEERTKVWPEGSLEETVQNAIKTWEMELSHKTRIQDFTTINPEKFKLFVNGREGLSGQETLEIGSYNALLKTSLPENFQFYKADQETYESSHDMFRTTFPRGFAWEVISVYSGPPVIAFKFRHWGYMEGPFQGHAPTGERAEFYGLAIMKVDESLKAEEVEIYYDPGELFGGLLKGPTISDPHQDSSMSPSSKNGCPFYKGD